MRQRTSELTVRMVLIEPRCFYIVLEINLCVQLFVAQLVQCWLWHLSPLICTHPLTINIVIKSALNSIFHSYFKLMLRRSKFVLHTLQRNSCCQQHSVLAFGIKKHQILQNYLILAQELIQAKLKSRLNFACFLLSKTTWQVHLVG